MASSLPVSVRPTIFREYIRRTKFKKVPIHPEITEFHFIMAFARADNNGKFTPQWDTDTLNRNTITKIKNDYKKVNVVFSIGGPHERPVPFINPSNKDEWIQRAIDSLKTIITDYNLDGIDINYENIDATPDDFASVIGKVINGLRDVVNIVASIAPSKGVGSHYATLYHQYNGSINWVNYQFYDEPLPTVDALVGRYKELINYPYPKGKLLPGLSTDPHDEVRLRPEVFLDFLRGQRLTGAFIWDADNSANSNFPYENTVQEILVRNAQLSPNE